MASGAGHKGSKRVNRGGSYWNDARNVRPAYRNWWIDEHDANHNLGFRLSREQGCTDGASMTRTATGREGFPTRESPLGGWCARRERWMPFSSAHHPHSTRLLC